MKNVSIISTIVVVASVTVAAFAVYAVEGNGQKICTDDGINADCSYVGQGCSATFYSEPCTSCVSGNPDDNCVVTGDYTVDVTVYSNGTCQQVPGQSELACGDCDVDGPNPTSCNYVSN